MTPQDTSTLQDFLSRLLFREQTLKPEQVNQSLVFADTLLLHAFVRPHIKGLPPQVAIVGPTQAGKSSVVNLLIGHNGAKASPLAGFTRHAQGFVNGKVNTHLQAATNSLLPWLTFTPQDQLNNENIHQYSLTEVPSNLAEPIQITAQITWDSPDFDSVSSRGYRSTVPMLCAVSDLIVMVVSREKYADQSVWEMLRLFAPVGKPTLLCINKTQAETRAEILQAVEKKLKAEGLEHIEVLTLPYLHNENTGQLSETPAANTLRERVAAVLSSKETSQPSGSIERFLSRHWEEWVAPAKEENIAAREWNQLVETSLDDSILLYQQQFLEEPQHKDAIQKAMLRLLDLLEIPGIGGALGRIRGVITWPVRQLGSQLGGFIKKQRKVDTSVTQNPEQRILDQGFRHALLTLSQEAGHRSSSGSTASRQWWQALLLALNEEQQKVETSFPELIGNHQKTFDPQIDAAAQQLYSHLSEHPLTLNGLRAARTTTDAASVVLALKSGGIGAHDLVLTPAMLAFSSLLTESAIGKYMGSVEDSLKKAQLESVRQHVRQPLEASLKGISQHMDCRELYSISAESLQSATQIVEGFS